MKNEVTRSDIISPDTPQHNPVDDAAFKAELASLIPHLRAFGRNLCGNPDLADDLVQETMLKAWKARGHFDEKLGLCHSAQQFPVTDAAQQVSR
jgi:Sigma-70 region 2